MIRHSRAPVSLAVLVLALTACAGGDESSEAGLVARAGDQSWTVAAAAALLAPDTVLPAKPEAIRALANLWIDYTVLARAAMADTTLSQVDVSPLVNDLVAQQMITALRDSVISVEPIGGDELQQRYRREGSGSLVRARQILLTWPDDPTQAQKDSVRRIADDLRARIVDGGGDFAALAREHSQDPGSAGRGGEMGVIRRGQMLPSMDSALFSLQQGEVSHPVDSPYGLHILQVEERLSPTLAQFRADLMNRRAAKAESVFVAGLEARASPEILEGAEQRVRDLARNYRAPLSRGEEERPLLKYQGGSVTEGEVLWYLQSQPPETRVQVAASHDKSIADRILRAVEHRELLQAEARRRGWSAPQGARERVAATARHNLVEAARQLGLLHVEVAPDQQPGHAVQVAVSGLLSDMLTGRRREVTPLGLMSYVLRRQYPAHVVETGLNEVAARVEQIRRSP